jgi:hypothetical protein
MELVSVITSEQECAELRDQMFAISVCELHCFEHMFVSGAFLYRVGSE